MRDARLVQTMDHRAFARYPAALLLLVAGAAAGTVGVVVVACGSSSPAATPCNENPWQCASGQTCWPQSCNCPGGWQFACLASVSGTPLGSNCTLEIGKVACGDTQTCVFLQDASDGVCRAYCDPSNPSHGC